ncbi:MAG: hypothetical protein JRD68_07035 [Deltaproteobacteria bacterium]|nr:hypothetical protein [Deltaproteobacteria bacterium]
MQVVHREPIDLEFLANLLESTGIPAPLSLEDSVSPAPRDQSKFHVSNLIDSAQQIIKGINKYHKFQGSPKGIMSLGRIWESVADAYVRWWANKQGGGFNSNYVMEKDEIVASLDGIAFVPHIGPMVQETKLRFSLKEDIPIRHLRQVKAYCHMVHSTKVLFTILNLSSAPPTVMARLELIEFSVVEIEENWEMIVNTKKFLESIGEGPTSG